MNAAKADKIFREVASGRAVKGRPQLERVIDALGSGDVLVIAEWDRATRSMMGGIGIIGRVAVRSAAVKVLDMLQAFQVLEIWRRIARNV